MQLNNKIQTTAANEADINSMDIEKPPENNTQFKTYKKKKIHWKHIINGLMLLIIIGGSISAYFLNQQNQDIRQQANVYEHKVDLTFNPKNITVAKGQTKKIPIIFDTHGNHITAADVELSFNKELISIVSISSAGLPVTLSAPKIGTDKARFVYAVYMASDGISGSGTLAEIEVKLLQEKNASIIIKQTTKISIIESATNTIGNILNNRIKLK